MIHFHMEKFFIKVLIIINHKNNEKMDLIFLKLKIMN